MSDDNILQFTGKAPLTIARPSEEVVLTIRPDGTKVRGDGKPLTQLTHTELVEVIDKLCDLIMRR